MKQKVHKQKLRVVVVWLLCVLTIGLSLFGVGYSLYSVQAKEDLLEHTTIVADQIPALTENDFYSQAGYAKLQFDKLKALAFALEADPDVNRARTLLENFVLDTGADALMLLDMKGTKLYTTDEAFGAELNLDEKTIRQYYEDRYLEGLDRQLTYTDEFVSSIFQEEKADRQSYALGWFVADRWLLVMQEEKTAARFEVEQYFYWANVLERIQISTTGCLLAIDENDGTVLAYGAKAAQGQSLAELDLRLPGEKQAAELSALKASFADTNRVVTLRIDGEKYYAARVAVDGVLLLALLPLAEVLDNAWDASVLLTTLTLLVTGLYAFYVILHMGTEDEDLQDRGSHYWARGLSHRLHTAVALTVAATLLLGAFLGALSIYADTFSYCRQKTDNVVELAENNFKTENTLLQLSNQEYLSRCQTAKTILAHAGAAADRSYLRSLCKALSLRYIYVLDENGAVLNTNSPYDRNILEEDSPFNELLNGRPWMVGSLTLNEETGEYSQIMGLSLRDEQDRSNGALLFELDPVENRTIDDNLGVKSMFEQVCLLDHTFVLVVDADDLGILYTAEVEGGSFGDALGHYDYRGLTILDLGVNEDRLRDSYNGNMLVLNDYYFASLRRVDNFYIMVLRPQLVLKLSDVLPVLMMGFLTLVVALVLLFVSCWRKPQEALPEPEEEKPEETKQAPPKQSFLQEWLAHWREEHDALMESLMSRKNALFEERWPKDGVKWADKSPKEKFFFAVRLVAFCCFLGIIIHTLIAGDRAIWYYCISGDLDRGFNLYSIGACLISISLLAITKLVGHRLLYLTARVTDSKGETICHLIDNTLGYVLFIVGVFTCLYDLGVSTTTLSLTGGVAGVIFGIGCQNIVADILAGIIMVFEGVVFAGDFIALNGRRGFVQSIGVRTTQVKYFGELIIVRNNEFKNYIKMGSNAIFRIKESLYVDYREPLERVEAIFKEELPRILQEVRDFAKDQTISGLKYRGVKELEKNGYVMSFCIFAKGKRYGKASRGLNRSLLMMCRRRNIRIALPQVVVHEPEPLEGPELPKELDD